MKMLEPALNFKETRLETLRQMTFELYPELTQKLAKSSFSQICYCVLKNLPQRKSEREPFEEMRAYWMTYHIQQAYCMSKDLESGAIQLMEAF